MYAIPILLASATVIVTVNKFHYKKKNETDYEQKMKILRQSLLQGKLDKKSFLYIKDNLKVEDVFGQETQRLENMLKEKNVDTETYSRMKKILSMTFNEKLEIIAQKYNYTDSNTLTKDNHVSYSFLLKSK
jgi:hypothetical protein